MFGLGCLGCGLCTTLFSFIVCATGAYSFLRNVYRFIVIASGFGDPGSGLGYGEGLKPVVYYFLATLRMVMRGFTWS